MCLSTSLPSLETCELWPEFATRYARRRKLGGRSTLPPGRGVYGEDRHSVERLADDTAPPKAGPDSWAAPRRSGRDRLDDLRRRIEGSPSRPEFFQVPLRKLLRLVWEVVVVQPEHRS